MIPKTAIEYFVSVYNSKELTAKVKKLDERFDTEDGTRIPVIAAVLLELGSWQGNDFARMTADERLAFIKGNDSLYLANFDDLIEMASTLTQFHRNGNPNKKAAIEFLEKTINALDGKAEVSQRNGTPPVNQFSLAKGTDEILRTEYPAMRWIVEGLIPEGLTVLAGKSKAGKSWLLLQMALAVAKGQSFLGFNTVKTKAVYLALMDYVSLSISSIDRPVTLAIRATPRFSCFRFRAIVNFSSIRAVSNTFILSRYAFKSF